MKTILLAALVLLSVTALAAGPTPIDMDKRARELKDLKWGMYLCWSFASFANGCVADGRDINLFNPTGCDTDQWAKTAKEAGMGFICFLTKHHDGFCLWDTATTDRKVTKTKALSGRDVLAEMRKSCDKYGIKLALYYSEGDWTWPGARKGQMAHGGANPEVKKAQLKELLTRYGAIEFLWLDDAVSDGGLSHKETAALCKSLQPGCFVGFNEGESAGDLQLGEDGRPAPMDHHVVACPYMDNNPPERWDPAYKGYKVHEVLQPFMANPDIQWFYHTGMGDKGRSAEDLYHTVRGAVKYGCIFDLGVTPTREGKLRDIEVKTLRRVGAMLRNPPPRRVSLSTGKPAKASSCWRPEYDASKAVDGDETTSWAFTPVPGNPTELPAKWAGDHIPCSGWLEVDLQEPREIGAVSIKERFSLPMCAIKLVDLEYRDAETEAWKVAFHGGEIAGGGYFGECIVKFPPVTARYVRLNIKKAVTSNRLVAVEEFHVWPPNSPDMPKHAVVEVGAPDNPQHSKH